MIARKGAELHAFTEALDDLCPLADRVRPAGEAPACRDEHDRMYLHCAVTARVDFLVTWDDDLLSLKSVDEIPIVTPGSLIRHLGFGGGGRDG